MRPLASTAKVGERPSHERGRRWRSKPVRCAAAALVAAAVLALGLVAGPPRVLRAGAPPQAAAQYQPVVTVDPFGVIAASRDRLNQLQDEILGLGALALASLDAVNRARVQALNQSITVLSAAANFENAKLTREVAEIAVAEYEEGIFKQDQATAMGELKLAEVEVARSADSIEFTKSQLNQIMRVSKGSAEDLALEFSFEDNVVRAGLRESSARRALEKAKSKLDLLQKYIRPRRVRELKSEIEKARSDELAKQAQWERGKSELKKLQEATKPPARDTREQRVLTLLDRAVPIAEQLKTRLDEAEQDRNPGEQLRKEISDTLGQLRALVERAHREDSAAKWAKLKPKVHDAAERAIWVTTRNEAKGMSRPIKRPTR